MDVTIIHAPKNVFRGPWTFLESLDLASGWNPERSNPFTSQRQKTLGTQALHCAWSPRIYDAVRSPCSVLAVSTRSGEVLLWSRARHDGTKKRSIGPKEPLRISVGSRPIIQVKWSEIQPGTELGLTLTLLAVVASLGPRLIFVQIKEDGELGDCQLAIDQPPPLPYSPQVTLAQFLPIDTASKGFSGISVTTPGRLHLWTRQTGFKSSQMPNVWQSFDLGPIAQKDRQAFGGDRDSTSVAVALTFESFGPPVDEASNYSLLLILASGLQYRIALNEIRGNGDELRASGKRTLLPLKAPASTGREREDLLHGLKIQLEANQRLTGLASLGRADNQSKIFSLLVCQTDDEVAGFRVLTHHFVKVSLLLSFPISAKADHNQSLAVKRLFRMALIQGLKNDADKVGLTTALPITPIQALQPALNIYHSIAAAAKRHRNETGTSAAGVSSLLLESVVDICSQTSGLKHLPKKVTSKPDQSGSTSGSTVRILQPTQRALWQRLYWLCSWAISQLAGPPSAIKTSLTTRLLSLKNRLHAFLLVDHLVFSLHHLKAESALRNKQQLIAKASQVVFASVSSFATQVPASETQRELINLSSLLAAALKNALEAYGRTCSREGQTLTSQALDGVETCPACSQPVPLEVERPNNLQSSSLTLASPANAFVAPRGDSTKVTLDSNLVVEPPLYARCSSGHVWRRCGRTFCLLTTPDIKTCVGCRLKVEIPGPPSPKRLSQDCQISAQATVSTCNHVRGKRKRNDDEVATPKVGDNTVQQSSDVATGVDLCHMCGNVWVQMS